MLYEWGMIVKRARAQPWTAEKQQVCMLRESTQPMLLKAESHFKVTMNSAEIHSQYTSLINLG